MSRRKNLKLGENREVLKNQKIKLLSRAERSGAENHVTEGIFCLLLRYGQKQDKQLVVQLFLVRLLVPLALAGRPHFRLVIEASGLTVGLAIGGAEFIGGEVAVGFSGWSRWKVLMSLQRCSTAEVGFQVFFSSR